MDYAMGMMLTWNYNIHLDLGLFANIWLAYCNMDYVTRMKLIYNNDYHPPKQGYYQQYYVVQH